MLDIKDAQGYLDIAFRRVKKFRKSSKKKDSFKDILVSRLLKIVYSFPDINNLEKVQRELLKRRIGIRPLKSALKKIKGAVTLINKIAKEEDNLKSFYGRVSSIVYDLDPYLEIVKKASIELERLPVIKDMFRVAITGYPNAGKTTLYNLIGKSKARVDSYPFTTTRVNTIVSKIDGYEFQLFDTPGIIEGKSKVEEESFLIMKFAAHMIVMVIDPTQPLEPQEKLLERIKDYDPILFSIKMPFKNTIHNIEELKRIIYEKLKEYYLENYLRRKENNK